MGAALAAAFSGAIERTRPVEARLARVHDCLWLRLWLRPATRSASRARVGPGSDWFGECAIERSRQFCRDEFVGAVLGSLQRGA